MYPRNLNMQKVIIYVFKSMLISAKRSQMAHLIDYFSANWLSTLRKAEDASSGVTEM